jgi:DNA-binding transcriptional LysR family regulator
MLTTNPEMPGVTLNALVAFERVARLMNFAQAARQLGVSPTAISKTVRTLEGQLGVRLFNRTTRSVSLTEHGSQLLNSLSPALDLISTSVQQVTEEASGPNGLLRINTSYVAFVALIEPHQAAFTAQYPRIQLDFTFDDRLVDIVDNGFDAGIRSGRSLHNDMIALPMGGVQRHVIVASPKYLAQVGCPQKPQDLLRHNCIRQRFNSLSRNYEWRFTLPEGPVAIEVNGNLLYSEMRSAMEAARRGLGFAYVFSRFAEEYIKSGELVPLLEDQCSTMDGFYIYYPSRRHQPGKLKAFIEFMQAMNSGAREP